LEIQLIVENAIRVLAILVSWPVAALIAVYWLRKPITDFLDRFKRGRVGNVEIEVQDRQQQQQQTSSSLEIVEKPLDVGTTVVTGTGSAAGTSTVTGVSVPPPTPPASNLISKLMHSIQHSPDIEPLKGEAREQLMARAFAERILALSFERTYRVIFGSQIEAVIAANSPGGATIESLKETFENAKKRFPVAHEKRTFEQWLAYLKAEGMIEEVPSPKGDPLFRTTEYGKGFLHYMVEQGLQPKFG
jgi:hypothetical protein